MGDNMIDIYDEGGDCAALNDLGHDLLACGDGAGFFCQDDVVLFSLFVGYFFFCFVLECLNGADGDTLRILYGGRREKEPFAVVAEMFEILFGFLGALDEI